MKVKSIKIVTSDKPIPVYDATSPKYHNLTLGNGCVVHNTGKKARFEQFQEIFPLTGKTPNIWKLGSEKTFANQRVIDLLRVIGYDPKNPGVYRVGKLMLLTDSDVDGLHIEALLLGLIARVAPDLFKRGMVYSVNAPLFMYQRNNGEKEYGSTMNEIIAKVGKGFNTDRLTRLKGWGEAPWQMLREVAFEPKSRSLTQITGIKDAKDTQIIVDMLGEDVSARKVMLGL